MSFLADLSSVEAQRVWDGVAARALHGDRLTVAVVELDPGSLVPEHSHEQEQLGLLLQGTLTFRVGEEARDLEAGGTWCIPSGVPHEVRAGPEGAVVVDVFAPIRSDWERLERIDGRPPRWP